MRAADFPPFEAAVEAGVAAVMCSYNRVNGSHACIPVWGSNLRLADLCCACQRTAAGSAYVLLMTPAAAGVVRIFGVVTCDV